MTAQIPDVLIYEDEAVRLFTTPLEQYFDTLRHRPQFGNTCTALERGYVAQWKLDAGQLWIVDLTATFPDGSCVTLRSLFPDSDGRVLADWFTGELRIPRGKRLKYIHMGFSSIYESELKIQIKQGVVGDIQLADNLTNFEKLADHNIEIPDFLRQN